MTIFLLLGQESESSVGMEKVACESCLDELISYGVNITVLTTDRSSSIIGLMQHKYFSIDHQHDIWHIAKSIKKHLLSQANKKGLECLKDWIRSVVNHLYYCSTNCNEQSEILIELWKSLSFHVSGVHQWNLDGVVFKQINCCRHDASSDEKLLDEGRAVSYLKDKSDAHTALKKVTPIKKIIFSRPIVQFRMLICRL